MRAGANPLQSYVLCHADGRNRDERPGFRIAYRTDCHLLNQRRMNFHSRVSTITVHELLFADDCALNTTSEEEMKRSMDLFLAACENFGLVINTQKTVVMHQPPSNRATIPPPTRHKSAGTEPNCKWWRTFRTWAVTSPATPRLMRKTPTGSRKPVKTSAASKAQFGVVTVSN
ncbi:hypothetical protein SprV_0401392300 [Sparganum proliferum]